MLSPSIYLVQRRPELWGEDAADFRPARFLEDVPGYAWIPFGGGVRRCIGAAFAQMEMEVVLRAIAGAVRLEPVGRRGASDRTLHHLLALARGRGPRRRPPRADRGDEARVAIAA